ncbi:ISL3 family transposase [Saccharopolyspora sp. ASAGF58]|uniref:ISL3 family transposase n=1 Tax=Saccharopolyspora sp. ASAGF58 TaxID=2719023 RepID=UPI001B314D03|nr:ISL3 family transposase [Saccharopolyspora sp. ASAGF58]
MLLPHLAGVVVERVEQEDAGVRIWASARASSAACPACGNCSARVHSRYDRTVADVAVAGRPVVLWLRVRRFFCTHQDCSVRTFAEQVEGLTMRHARRSLPLRGMLESIGLALAGRAGARLANRLGLRAGRDTLLRLVRAVPDPPVEAVTVLGVDDFAIRRGQNYATILLDMATHRPVDVLEGREADTLAEWLKKHPEIQVITRDRSGAYAEGASRGAPQAVQCADRWHLWKNLGEAVEKTVLGHRGCLIEPAVDDARGEGDTVADGAAEVSPSPTPVAEPAVSGEAAESGLAARIRQRYAAVQSLRAQGKRIRAVARELDLDRKTARRYFQAGSVEELLSKTASRSSLLDEYKPYLHQRFNDGCANVSLLVREIREQGYGGSAQTVYRYLRPFRSTGKAPESAPRPPKIREVVGWIMRDPDNLPDDDGQRLKAVLARCPELEATRRHVGAFASVIRDLRGDLLPDWMDRVCADDLPALRSFVNGLRQDLAAVTAGLTLTWSNGPTEGAVNRAKYLKRQSFGRAKLDLLRKRILLTT